MNKTRDKILSHFAKYPQMELTDLLKYLHQSAFGCEHLVTDEAVVLERIEKEAKTVQCKSDVLVEELDGAFCRVHLSVLQKGMQASTLARLFFLSAQVQQNAAERLAEKLSVLMQLIQEGLLPFDEKQTQTQLAEWKNNGFSACRHSQVFRDAYAPAYRVIKKEFAQFLPLFIKTDKLLQERDCLTFAVEGGSASGKSTLAGLLSDVYGCTVFHMDDFFLQPQQRTSERLAQAGGNVDRERFLEEVLLPHSKGKNVCYRRFDCGSQTIQPAEEMAPTRLTVTEGAYSMHPTLAAYYDFAVFLDIDPALQRKRILQRNGTEWGQRFFDEWIPMELLYFEKMNVKDRCDLCFSINE